MKVNEPTPDSSNTLKKELSTIQSRIWAKSVCSAIEQRLGCSGVTAEQIASFFPCSEAIRQGKFGDKEYLKRLSTQYWARVLSGERGVKDQGLIQRVEQQLGSNDRVLRSPLCAILKMPHMRSVDYTNFIAVLSPALENRVFTKQPQSYHINQSQCYWCWRNVDLTCNEEFLAYQLLLINRQFAKANKTHKLPSLKNIVLHFWRFLHTSPFGEFAETLCEALIFYLQENISVKQNFCWKGLPNHFSRLRNMVYPELSIFPGYTNSYEEYFAYNRKVCETAECQLTGGIGAILSSAKFNDETLYLADRFASHWMRGDYEKASIFTKGRPEYLEVALARNFHTTHRIW